ncbi:MAG TPA: hypothetical protein PK079_10775 [Leptospiraceae bacterium]|nr:hypothetical protein [Leptospiraceae bacterium]HMW05883.1 hypothetical protein [Leptospiraceae bacterium]HMY32752.1 hypothetical protein [Leptospiraceae bacterium]HMZ62559.1 hypothetical protein [Leptospiraceae bacterium]HNA05792.1 hypothetical protein [Leptospiraceae bacterium]
MKKKLSVILIILFTMNWMYLSESKAKWSGLNPVVGFFINPKIIGFKSSKNQPLIAKEFLDAAGEWFQKGGYRFSFKFQGITLDKPASVEDIDCTARTDVQQGDAVFFAEPNSDPDCTASSCVYLWSCNGSIVHADVQLNNSDFNWNHIGSDGDVKNLKTEALKAFGYMAGLGHCKTGDTVTDCQARTGSDPKEGSVMYKFPQIGRIDQIGSDEVTGIQTLYGTLNLPFPTSGKYSLTYGDMKSIQDFNSLNAIAGNTDEDARKRGGQFLDSLSDYNFKRTKRTLPDQYDEFYNLVKMQTPTFDKEDLEHQRELLTQGIVSAVKLKEDALKGYHKMDPNFIQSMIDRHLKLRNLTIDALEGK